MDPYAVTVISMKDVPAVGLQGQIRSTTRVTIQVGHYGTFTKDFDPPANTAEVINSWKQEQANKVKAVVGI